MQCPNPAAGHMDPRLHQRLLDTHRQVWASLMCDYCSFLLGPGAHKVLFVPSKCLFLQPCVSSGDSMVGLVATSSKKAYAIPRSAVPRAPAPVAGLCWPVPLQETLKHSSVSVSVGSLGPDAHKAFFESSKHLWRVWGLILNVILPLLPSCWGFSFSLGYGVSLFGGIQHSPVDGCSSTSCNFGVLTGEDEHTSFYSTTL